MALDTFDPLWLSASLLVVSALALLLLRKRRSAFPLPPGPPRWPIIGNYFNYPKTELAKALFELHKRYGPLVHLSVFGKSTISIGSYAAACDLLDKRSANYSDRPNLVIGEMSDMYHWNFPLMSYGSGWRARRRVLHNELLPSSLTKYQQYQLHVTHKLLRNLLASPTSWEKHLEHTFTAVALLVAYGLEPQEDEDRYVGMLKELNAIGADVCVPGRYLVESLPILRYFPSWFPGAGFKREIDSMKKRMRQITSELWEAGKRHLEQGAENDSVLATIMRDAAHLDKDAAAEQEAIGAGVATTVYTAGADTTATAMRTFFLAMALYPDAQKKAQEELDRVVGSSRLPDFSDRDSLPYVNALVKEVLRWHVGTPTSLPHASIQDDVYNGYFIPGGSIVLPNLWGFAKDPDVYPDPNCFNPDRFLKDGQLNNEVQDPATIIFGFGRRICPGQHLASAALFLNCASVLHAFNISPPLDAHGKPTLTEAKFIYTVITSEPAKFECEIRPRSSSKATMIEQLVY